MVEIDILPGSKFRTDVDISGGNESTMSPLFQGTARFKVRVGHR